MTDEELKKQIAEKVMGWHTVRVMGVTHWLPKSHTQPHHNDPFITHNYGTQTDWNPINNANHWMMVAERLNEMFLDVELRIGRYAKSCQIRRIDYPVPMDSWYAEDKIRIGRAVCKAGLAILETREAGGKQ